MTDAELELLKAKVAQQDPLTPELRKYVEAQKARGFDSASPRRNWRGTWSG